MAVPLPADRLLSALRAEGVGVREYKSWRTHNRDSETGRAFGPVNGVIIHHTAGSNSLALCYNGTSSLPGPLCHTHLSKAGVATMVGHGRTNHAGSFAQNAHNAVVAETPTHPRPDASEPVDANDKYYGIEIENLGNGRDPYPAVQYDAAVRWAAAICRAHGWTAHSVIGHKEGTRRKIDPTFSMNTFRADVAERLKHPASWSPGKDEEDPLSGMTDKDIAKAVWLTDGVVGVPADWTKPTNREWMAASIVVDTGKRVRSIEKQMAAQNATITELVKTVGSLATGSATVDTEELVARIRQAIESVTVRLDVEG
jgi:hypothetical protein